MYAKTVSLMACLLIAMCGIAACGEVEEEFDEYACETQWRAEECLFLMWQECNSECPCCKAGFACSGGGCVNPDWSADEYPTPDCGDDDMCRVPAGSFLMGCDQAYSIAACASSTLPPHSVFVSSFKIDRYQVSKARYKVCVEDGVCTLPECNEHDEYEDREPGNLEVAGDYPATCVTWQQASEFCEWDGKRLPTEAEWEKAARGTDGRISPDGNRIQSCTGTNMSVSEWESMPFDGCGFDDLVDVTRGLTSPYGVVGMTGNAAEWVSDWYDIDYYAEGFDIDPVGPDSGTSRGIRGGDFMSVPETVKVYARDAQNPDTPSYATGFRCASTFSEQ